MRESARLHPDDVKRIFTDIQAVLEYEFIPAMEHRLVQYINQRAGVRVSCCLSMRRYAIDGRTLEELDKFLGGGLNFCPFCGQRP